MHLTKRTRRVFLVGLISSFVSVACGIAIKRDLTADPRRAQVGYDDMCGLQDYFDTLEAGLAKDPVVASSLDLEGGDGQKTIRGGKVRIRLRGRLPR